MVNLIKTANLGYGKSERSCTYLGYGKSERNCTIDMYSKLEENLYHSLGKFSEKQDFLELVKTSYSIFRA